MSILGDILGVLNKSASLIEYALPVAKLIAMATPTQIDDRIVQAAEKWAIPTAKLFVQGATGLDKVIKDGGRQKIAIEILRGQLIEILQVKGQINWGDQIIDSVEKILEMDENSLAVAVVQALELVNDNPAAVPELPPQEAPLTPTGADRPIGEIEERISRLRSERSLASPAEQLKIDRRIARQTEFLAEAKRRAGLLK